MKRLRFDKKLWYNKNNKRAKDIIGISVFDTEEKSVDIPTGYCACMRLTKDGTLELWTNGRYQFIGLDRTRKTLKAMLRYIEELKQ